MCRSTVSPDPGHWQHWAMRTLTQSRTPKELLHSVKIREALVVDGGKSVGGGVGSRKDVRGVRKGRQQAAPCKHG